MRWQILLPLALSLLAARPAEAPAQEHRHAPGMRHPGPQPEEAGQAAYAAIAEVVRILEADSSTDWARVDLERLRRHLVDMDAVTLRSSVVQAPIPGGLRVEVTGEGPVVGSIRRMAGAHFAREDATSGMRATVEEIPGGSRLTLTALDPRGEARIRGLGFIGLLARTEHHGPHHLAMARGGEPHGAGH